MSSPISLVLPATILITPSGIPALDASSQIANAERGVAFAGLQTTVQPAANRRNFSCQHGVRKIPKVLYKQPPTGCFVTIILLS